MNQLKSKPDVFNQYKRVIEEQVDAGIVEVVTEDINNSQDSIVHYIPHSGVVKQEREATKLRVVYEASCKVVGESSLNQCLESGPNLFASNL